MAIQKNNGLAYDLSLFEPDASASEAGQKNTAKKKAENKVIDLGIPQAKRAEKRKLNPVTILEQFDLLASLSFSNQRFS